MKHRREWLSKRRATSRPQRQRYVGKKSRRHRRGHAFILDARGTSAIVENFRKHAAELVAATLDVVLAITTNAVLELQKASRTVPIVFAQVIDPVGSGLVRSLARHARTGCNVGLDAAGVAIHHRADRAGGAQLNSDG